MSPKSATIISLALLSLSLTTLTLSSATHTDCPDFDSVPDILKHYDIPPGLFPNDVKYFRCDPVNKDAHRLLIRLHGVCKVTRELLGVGNTVVCQPDVSAIISYRQLTHIKGVTVTLTFHGKPVGELMTVTEAKVFATFIGKVLQFNSDKGPSPFFPVVLINKPPTCDRSSDAAVDDDSSSAGVVAAKDDNQDDVPIWVYKYGRLLPFVAA